MSKLNGGVLHYTHEHVVKIHEGHTKLVNVLIENHKEEVEYLITTLRQVVACFKSRAESSTCVEEHHPSCLGLVEARLKEYKGDKGEKGDNL